MPFIRTEGPLTPFALPKGFDLGFEPEDDAHVELLGAGLRQGSSVWSQAVSFRQDTEKPYDPEYRPFEDLQGTPYEQYADRFLGVRDRSDTDAMKAQIDMEVEDRKALAAAGWLGVVTEMGGSLLSPTTLIPGAYIMKGARGVSVARTALATGALTGVAVSIDEAALQQSQQLRTGFESATAIGGSVVLGSLLGAWAGKMTKAEFTRTAANIETFMGAVREVSDGSIGAARVATDMRLRNEWRLQLIRRIPGLGLITRSDPLIRAQMSELQSVRRIVTEMTETPLQYAVNERGEVVNMGTGPMPLAGSVEQRVTARINDELTGLQAEISKAYGAYYNDGSLGVVGRLSAPIRARTTGLMSKSGKLNASQFRDEVGRALLAGDQHAIPQIQDVAQKIRKRLDTIEREANEAGLFNSDYKPEHMKSYFMRVYDQDKVVRHWGDGTADDMSTVLMRNINDWQAQAAHAAAEAKRVKADIAALEKEIAKHGDEAKADLAALGRRGEAAEARARQMANFKTELTTWEKRVAIGKLTDGEAKTLADDTIRSIVGLNGEHSITAAMSTPTKARVLDVPDEMLQPWLVTDASRILDAYYRHIIPDLELTRKFGSVGMAEQIDEIQTEVAKKIKAARPGRRDAIKQEGQVRIDELLAMRDRIRGVYGIPKNPNSLFVRAGRVSRTFSYVGLLGGMVLAAIPDVAGIVGRNGIEVLAGPVNLKRLVVAGRQSADIGAAAEWFLNSRVLSIAEIHNVNRGGSMFERGMATVGTGFSFASGMIPWNVAFKSMGGAISMSGALKAAKAVARGRASKKQLIKLSENGIDAAMADRIAAQFDQFGDGKGRLWIANAGQWTDREAFEAFRGLMNREMSISIITPGQDKPLFWSTEAGKFLSQFKSFALASNHRILLSGIQRGDADVLAQFTIMALLGGVVSNVKADIGGYDRKEGAAFWADAIDRSGMAGWLFEANAAVEAFSGGTVGVSAVTGEKLSRFQSRSQLEGLFGPGVDQVKNLQEATSAYMRGELKQTDVSRAMSYVPGQNLPYLLWLFDKIEKATGRALGAEQNKP